MADEIEELVQALVTGTKTLDEVAARFRQRSWPRRARPAPRSYQELAAAELEDPEPYVAGSFDAVAAAYHRGDLSGEQYDALAGAMTQAKIAEDEGRP